MNHEKVIVRMRKMINAYGRCGSHGVDDLKSMMYDLVDLVEELIRLHAPPAAGLHNVCCRCGKKADDLGLCDSKRMCYDCWIVGPVGGEAVKRWDHIPGMAKMVEVIGGGGSYVLAANYDSLLRQFRAAEECIKAALDKKFKIDTK